MKQTSSSLTSHFSIFSDRDPCESELLFALQHVFDRVGWTQDERVEDEAVLVFLDASHLVGLKY